MKEQSNKRSLSHNLTSLLGMVLAAIGFIAGTTLIIIDAQNHFDNPYTGIFIYLVVPAILLGGLLLVLVGVLLEIRRRKRGRTSIRGRRRSS